MRKNISKIKKMFIKNLKLILLFFCTIEFIALAEDVFNKEIMNGDIIGYKLMSHYLNSNFIMNLSKFVTNFGDAFILITITVLLILFLKNKKIGVSVGLNLIFITILNVILKNILQRPRPNDYQLVDVSGYSFPSGHSMVSMAFYGFLIYLIYKYIKNKYIKFSLIVFLSILIIIIGLSRIYLGVHYTSDVLAGFLIAISYLIIYIEVINKFLLEEKNEK